MSEFCSTCGGQLGLGFKILEYLRAQEFAVFIGDIYEAMPGHTEKAVRRVLVDLKEKDCVQSPRRGYYSA